MFKNNPLFQIINSRLNKLPTPINISYLWNYGSLLGLLLVIQILTGFFLSFHYKPDLNLAFYSVILITHDLSIGWLIRNIHCNGARFFFLFIYIHIARGLYYSSFKKKLVWLSGVTIYLIRIITAFLGYVLPWGQISLWGATVITNLLTVIPIIGNYLVNWIWGGFSVRDPTLNRFFRIHFIIPFILRILVIIHLLFLHTTGSSNPLGRKSFSETKIKFLPYYIWKDILGFLIFLIIFKFLSIYNPFILLDAANWIKANSIQTPTHIQPEWYFLFAYAILRTFTSKLSGVLALLLSVLILYFIPFLYSKKFIPRTFNPLFKLFYWLFIVNFIFLTYLGSLPATGINIFAGKVLRSIYFIFFLFFFLINQLWEKLNNKN